MTAANLIVLPRRWVIAGFAFSFLCVGPSAQALMILDLVPQVAGPYAPSAFVDVDVVLNNLEGATVEPRLVRLDFSATDPALTLPAAFNFQLMPPLISDALYSRFEAMPMVSIVFNSVSPVPGFILSIPDEGAFTLGTISIGLPPTAGVYTLDAVNVAAPDANTGARIDYGFDIRTTVHAVNGNLQGGTLGLTVVPEPTSFALLALGLAGFGFARRHG